MMGNTFRTLSLFFIFIATMLSAFHAHSVSATKTIKIGLTVSLTGDYDAQGKSLLQGLNMWADDINARGALLGRRVEIVYYDDGSLPERSAQLYEHLIAKDKADLLIGPYASNLTLSAAGVAEKHEIPMVSGTAAATSIWDQGYRHIFQVDVPAPAYMHSGLEIAKANGFKRLALLYQDNLFTQEVAAGAKEKAEELGIEVVMYSAYERDRKDFSALAKEMASLQADLLMGASYLDDSVAIVKALKATNYSPRAICFTSGPSLSAFGEMLGPDAEGIVGFTPWISAARQPMAQDFDFRYKRKFGRSPDSNAAGGYAAGAVIEAAVRLAGSLESEEVVEQLSTMDYVSLMGRYKTDETGKQIGKEMFLLQWQDGERKLVLPQEFAEVPYRSFMPWEDR